MSDKNNFNLIRLLAAVQVLIVHTANHFGYVHPVLSAVKLFPGVPVFFFISGYLLYASYERLTYERLRTFYFNRVVRIYPGLVVSTLLAVLAVYLSGYFRDHPVSPLAMTAWVLAQVSFLQFYNPSFMREFGAGVLNGSLWTIAVELQFYVFVPFLYYLLQKKRTVWIALLLGSLFINLMIRFAVEWSSMAWKLLYVSFAPWIYLFMTGFWLSSRRDLKQQVLRLNGGFLFVAYVLSMFLVLDIKVNSSDAINAISFLILAMLILKIAFSELRGVGRPFQKTDLSYGLYLYHMPVINLMLYVSPWGRAINAMVSVICTVILATLSWVCIEKPILDLKKRYASRAW